jgi:hypothetical protein
VPIHDPIHDEEQFERYLKQFRPLAPDALPTEKHRSARSTFVLAAWAAVAAVVIIALLILYPRLQQSSPRDDAVQWVGETSAETPQSLTIRSANALLTHAPSFKAAVDALAVPAHTLFDGKQSAFDVLSKDPTL